MKIPRILLFFVLLVAIVGADEKPTLKEKVVLPPDWRSIEIHTGTGSCWGESTRLYLTITKSEGGALVAISALSGKAKVKPRALTFEELKAVTERLEEYCDYFSGSGYRKSNCWLLHKVEYTTSKGAARGTLLERPALVQDLKSEEFHIWLRSLHPEAAPLFAETFWINWRKREDERAKQKQAEQAGTGQPATRPESKSEGRDKPQPESEGRSR
jgi:hypothetical protein